MTDKEQGELLAKMQKRYSYDSDTGLFLHKRNICKSKIGDIAGAISNGYIEIKNGKSGRIKAHRLAFLYATGSLPSGHIDHINRNRSDNRFENLRIVTHQENMTNKCISIKNTSGTTGVRFQNNRWIAEITVSYKKIYLGCYVSYSDAVDARRNAEVLYGFTNE